MKEINSEMFQEIVVYVIEMMTKKGEEILKSNSKWSKYKAKIIFNDVIKISSDYILEEELNALDDLDIYDKWQECLTKCKESISS